MSPQTVTGHRTGVTLGSAARTSRAMSQSACFRRERVEKKEEKRGRGRGSAFSPIAVERAIIIVVKEETSFFFSHYCTTTHLDLRLRQRAASEQPLDLRVELRARRGVRQGWRGRHCLLSSFSRWPRLSRLSKRREARPPPYPRSFVREALCVLPPCAAATGNFRERPTLKSCGTRF